MCKIVPVVVQGGAGEAECVGGPAEPGEHVWHRGESQEGVWAGSAVLWAHACIPEAVWDLRQVQQNQGTFSENTKIFRYAYLNKHLIYARSVCCWLIVGVFCTQEAEGLYKTMVKRFRQNKEVWFSYGTFLLQQGQSDAASNLLQRALKSLPPKESKRACLNILSY